MAFQYATQRSDVMTDEFDSLGNVIKDPLTIVLIKITRMDEQLKAREAALELARESLREWQRSSNEWREENKDQRSLYLTISKGESLIAEEKAARVGAVSYESSLRNSLEARIAILEAVKIKGEGTTSALSGIWIFVAAAAAIVISIIGLLKRGT